MCAVLANEKGGEIPPALKRQIMLRAILGCPPPGEVDWDVISLQNMPLNELETTMMMRIHESRLL